LARPKKYNTAMALERAVEAYFASITRLKTVTEKLPDGVDAHGHTAYKEVPVLNMHGEQLQVTEYLVPPTVHDLCDYLKIDLGTWENYCDSEKYPEFFRTTTRARGRMRAWNEHELLTRGGNDLKGIIFNLENNYGYRERAQVEMSGGLEQFIREMSESGSGQEF